jgi:4-diphosphocytidyl-2-C-methyl-D-erythritol kinase
MSDPGARLGPVVRLAPAKLNLTLAVVGRRPDGYHDLHSVMVPLGLADRLSVATTTGAADTVRIDGAAVDWPAERDMVRRAITATRMAVGRVGRWGSGPAPWLAARLEKRIPIAAGLAGGSSDAAAALDAAAEAWGAELEPAAHKGLALALGSDVPFFLAGGPALVEGRGERVTPLPPPIGSPLGVLLVTPAIAVRTPAVFAAYDGGVRPGGAATRQTSAHLASELHAGLAASAVLDRAGILASANDLAPATAAVVPELTGFRRAVFRLLGRPIGQSGSGPTLWALYPSLEAAAEAASLVRAAVADGRLEVPGGADPFVHATSIAPGGSPPWTVTPS